LTEYIVEGGYIVVDFT